MKIAQKIYRLWMSLSHVLGRIMSTILLTVLWIAIFGVYAIILKIAGLFAASPSGDSYWVDVSSETSDMRYQF